ncbi:MAG: protein-methionine-sulfoxide reductase heme-binding subunit MsrQ [Acidobacteriota bacterium]|nr:sulfoxide reductase heme-binding subunit YedZ [Blastocatellia bacterium]MDW8411306.1 protein-methionine-sulfoxide reductase heme-binding subunit MsrQ [Acidobacteriota bacterium]
MSRAYLQLLVLANGLLPALLLAFDALRHKLGVNPVEYFIRTTGVLSMVLLILTLAVTPVRQLSGLSQLIHVRRTLGLLSFFYALLHFLGYFCLEHRCSISSLMSDLANRHFVVIGMASFIVLLLLAITSTKAMVRCLGGRRWRQVHSQIYGSSVAALLHYWLAVKVDTDLPQVCLVLLVLLLGYRLLSRNTARSAVTVLKLR